MHAPDPAPHAETTPTPAGGRRAAKGFILAVVALDMVSIGLIVPVMPRIVEAYFGQDTAAAAHAFGLTMTLWALLQFFMSPILGALSDQFGRRPVILISCLGLSASFFATAFAPTFWLFLLSRMISGATAGNVSAANAYMADITPPAERARAFGLIGAAFGAGFMLGPALGGILGAIDIRLPLIVSGCLALANAVYGWLVLPESLRPELRTRFSWAKANPVGALGVFAGQPALYALVGVYGLFALAQNVFPSSFVLYAEHRYGFDTRLTGFTMAASALMGIAAQVLIVPRAVRLLGERRALIVGLVSGAAGFACYGLAPTPFWFWASMPVMVLWSLFMPSIQSLLTRRVSPSVQGRLQGGLASVMSVAGVIAPTLYTTLFAWGVSDGLPLGIHLPGAPFLVACAALLAGLGLTVRAVRQTQGSGPPG